MPLHPWRAQDSDGRFLYLPTWEFGCSGQQPLELPAEGITCSICICNLCVSSEIFISWERKLSCDPQTQAGFAVHTVEKFWGCSWQSCPCSVGAARSYLWAKLPGNVVGTGSVHWNSLWCWECQLERKAWNVPAWKESPVSWESGVLGSWKEGSQALSHFANTITITTEIKNSPFWAQPDGSAPDKTQHLPWTPLPTSSWLTRTQNNTLCKITELSLFINLLCYLPSVKLVKMWTFSASGFQTRLPGPSHVCSCGSPYLLRYPDSIIDLTGVPCHALLWLVGRQCWFSAQPELLCQGRGVTEIISCLSLLSQTVLANWFTGTFLWTPIYGVLCRIQTY